MNEMKTLKALLTAFLLSGVALCAAAKDFTLTSPSGELKLVVSVDKYTSYSLYAGGKPVLRDCRIAMNTSEGMLGDVAKVKQSSRGLRNETIQSPFYHQPSFETSYNYLTLKMNSDYSLQFRAYNDGVAYRFVTSFKDRFMVSDETVEFNFATNAEMAVPYVVPRDDRYETSFESQYTVHKAYDKIGTAGQLAFMPVYARTSGAGSFLLLESDVEEYPGMFLRRSDKGFCAEFPPVPSSTRVTDRGMVRAAEYSSFIAVAEGSRTFPWRIVAYARYDKDLPLNNMVYQTASPNRVGPVDWIRPGKCAWDWWNGFALSGVDFECGQNTALYKYHVDFAVENGLPYIVIDEGWYQNLDPLDVNPEVDVKGIINYASSKGVKVILWMTGSLLYDNADEICRHYSRLGVAGFKVDFFDAQDQNMVRLIYSIAETAARYRLFLDLHGMYKPSGLNRTYPNIVNFEGVYGLEQLKWDDSADMPRNDVFIPFIRQAAGPLDYTQGATRNYSRDSFRASFYRPGSQGTRAHQVALYVVFDSPLVMLCDSPTDYERNAPAMLSFIRDIPTVFDGASVVEGEAGRYIVTRREKDGAWYIGGITGWEERNITVSFDFLPAGEWMVRIFKDGPNAARVGEDTIEESISVTSRSVRGIHMAPGGGFAMIITKKQ